MFRAPDLGDEKLAGPEPLQGDGASAQAGIPEDEDGNEGSADAVISDPDKAEIRIDLSGIGGRP